MKKEVEKKEPEKKKRKSVKANKNLIDNPTIKKIQKEIDIEAKASSIPIENLDSDNAMDDLAAMESDDPNLADRIV